MANNENALRLRGGAVAWNAWRAGLLDDETQAGTIDLRGARLEGLDLRDVDLGESTCAVRCSTGPTCDARCSIWSVPGWIGC